MWDRRFMAPVTAPLALAGGGQSGLRIRNAHRRHLHHLDRIAVGDFEEGSAPARPKDGLSSRASARRATGEVTIANGAPGDSEAPPPG